MATTATVALSASKVRPGEKFTARLVLSRDVATEILTIIPNASRDTVRFGTVDKKGFTWECEVKGNQEEARLTIGATVYLTDNTMVAATIATFLCLGSTNLRQDKSNEGGEAGALKFNRISNGAHVAGAF